MANDTLPREIIANVDIAHASVTKIEALGFPTISVQESQFLEMIFKESYNLELTQPIVDRSISLRQTKRMGLGDSIIAATALEYKLELWTANIDDFRHIADLKLINPLA